MTPRIILGLAAVATLALGAAACSNDSSESANTTAAPATSAVPATTEAPSGSTTTTEGDVCTRGEIISAALTQVPAQFDLMDDFACVDGYAWAWLADDSTSPVTLQSAILEDDNGQWTSLNLANICGAASAGYPPEVLEKGCAYETPAQKKA
jgi:hypothetical protein